MNEPRFDAVLLDIGDTLMHFETSKPRRFVEAAARPAYDHLLQLRLSPPPFRRYVRKLQWAFLRAFVWSRLRGREVQTLNLLRRAHAAMGMPLTEQGVADLARCCLPAIRPFFHTDPESVPMVRRLHEAGLRLAIVSNTFFPGFAIDDVLEHEGLLRYFPVRVYSSDVGFMKPHPGIFRIALERVGVAPERAVMVGDRVDKDVRGARRVRLKTALVLHGRSRPRGSGADIIVNRLAELLPAFGIPAANVARADA